ncbi:hypothetical protein [Burkholderia phage BCSR5]|nr:hypothetical protein [Burkholderia phage BCSR5]
MLTTYHREALAAVGAKVGGATASEVSGQIGLDVGAVGTILAQLSAYKLVYMTRKPSPYRTGSSWHITDRGKAHLQDHVNVKCTHPNTIPYYEGVRLCEDCKQAIPEHPKHNPRGVAARCLAALHIEKEFKTDLQKFVPHVLASEMGRELAAKYAGEVTRTEIPNMDLVTYELNLVVMSEPELEAYKQHIIDQVKKGLL